MPMIEVQLLNLLLDSYERSKGFVENRSQHRTIFLRLYGNGKSDFPLYDIEDNAARCAVNEAARRLADQGLLTLTWMRGQENHILSKITLCTERLADAYNQAGRQPLAATVQTLEQQLQGLFAQAQADWLRHYLQKLLEDLAQKRRLPAAFPAEQTEQTEWLTVICQAAAPRPEPVLERVFSLRCLGDSKAFERRHRDRLLRVLKKHLPMDTAEMTDEELLRQIGLEKYPELFSICGAVQFRWPNGGRLDSAPLADGLQISARDAAKVKIILPPEIRTLLFVENKANYYDTLRNHRDAQTVVVFHGGCFSPQRGAFFQKLCRAASPGVRLLHWGDIDLGGFEMDSRLRREIDPRFTPWRMGLRELQHYRQHAVDFSHDYAARLEKLLKDPYLENSHDVIQYMLEHRLRLEQEAMIGTEQSDK